VARELSRTGEATNATMVLQPRQPHVPVDHQGHEPIFHKQIGGDQYRTPAAAALMVGDRSAFGRRECCQA